MEYQCDRCVNADLDIEVDATGGIEQVPYCFLDRGQFPSARSCEDFVEVEALDAWTA
jgi:hypothetical protein